MMLYFIDCYLQFTKIYSQHIPWGKYMFHKNEKQLYFSEFRSTFSDRSREWTNILTQSVYIILFRLIGFEPEMVYYSNLKKLLKFQHNQKYVQLWRFKKRNGRFSIKFSGKTQLQVLSKFITFYTAPMVPDRILVSKMLKRSCNKSKNYG